MPRINDDKLTASLTTVSALPPCYLATFLLPRGLVASLLGTLRLIFRFTAFLLPLRGYVVLGSLFFCLTFELMAFQSLVFRPMAFQLLAFQLSTLAALPFAASTIYVTTSLTALLLPCGLTALLLPCSLTDYGLTR